jgi:septum formation protein
MESLGLIFEVHPPLVDEEALKREGPRDLVELTRYLSKAKAQSLAQRFPQAVILGSDQLADAQGQRLDKPGGRERAINQLLQLQGKSHRLITSLCVLSNTQAMVLTDITQIQMRSLKRADIEAYVDLDQPFDCAGSYKIERAGMGLVEKIDSQDPSSIQGLPLISLISALLKLGFQPQQFWSRS